MRKNNIMFYKGTRIYTNDNLGAVVEYQGLRPEFVSTNGDWKCDYCELNHDSSMAECTGCGCSRDE